MEPYEREYSIQGRFLDEVYMHERIHSPLGYLTPAEFETQRLARTAAAQPIVPQEMPRYARF
jgi:transposase InsO family protein